MAETAAAAPASPPAPPPSPLPLLRSAAVVLLLATMLWSADATLSTIPIALEANTTAITFKAEIECPSGCRISYVTWQIKTPFGSWSPERKAPAEKTYTFDGLQPGTRYEVRAEPDQGGRPFMQEDTRTVTAYTCSDKVPAVDDLTATEIGTDRVVLQWHPPPLTCASVQYYFQQELYRKTYGRTSEQCPPSDLISPQPNYTCVAVDEVAGGRECRVAVSGLEAGDKYVFGILGVDQSGRCSYPHTVYVLMKRGPSPFGLSIGAWSCLILVIMIISASTPCLYAYWKRKTGRSLFGEDADTA